MRCAILIIGSLLWDSKTTGRAKWRASRLDVGARMPVRAPIYYGRKSVSRRNTYTMVLRRGEPTGQAVLVPCTTKIRTIDSLIDEANALWQAEAPYAKPGTLHKSWGCVGALFGPGAAHQELTADWTAHFQKIGVQCVSVVNPDGLLDIDWPSLPDGRSVDFDVILATANKAEVPAPTARVVADAWVDQCGYEEYFFNNVVHGIRTSDDHEIWLRIEEKAPCWLEKKEREYQQAIDILRSKVAPDSSSKP
jgi:hypothetical protein